MRGQTYPPLRTNTLRTPFLQLCTHDSYGTWITWFICGTRLIHMRNTTRFVVTGPMRGQMSPFWRTKTVRIQLMCTTWLIHVCDMSRFGHFLSIYYLWFTNLSIIHDTFSMRSTSTFLRTDILRIPFICATWLIHMCDMSRLNHDFSTYYLFISPLPWGQHHHSYAPILYEYHSYAQHDSFTCVTCHDWIMIFQHTIYSYHLFQEVNIHILTHQFSTNTTHMHNMTHSRVWHVTICSLLVYLLFI